MVRREPQFGNQMDAAPAGNRKHRRQAERGQSIAAGGAANVLLRLIAEQPDLTLDESVAAMRKRRITGSRSAVWRFFERHNISFKKTISDGVAPVGVETVGLYAALGRERPSAFWWRVTP
jgi:hypothetical protein